jgi:primosomal protein N'
MATIIHKDCAHCGKHTSYLVFHTDTREYWCAWCQRAKDIEDGNPRPWQLPNLYLD